MKKILLPVAIATVLGAMSVSCQKEAIVTPATEANETCSVHNIQYCVNGVAHSVTLTSDEEYDAFVQHLMGLARNGYRVSFRDSDKCQGNSMAKETVVYTTKNEDEAEAWGKAMVEAGYTVTISYNDRTGVYTCIAQK